MGRCKDCGAILGVKPDGFGWAYTCPKCDKPGVPMTDDEKRFAEFDRGMQQALERIEQLQREKRRLEARLHNLEQAMRGDDAGLIDEIRDLRAYVRRSDEAVRVVAEAIELRFPSDESSDGGHLRAWLRRHHVRIVRGDPRSPVRTPCPQCRVRGGHKLDCTASSIPSITQALADGDTVALANRLIASWEREAQVTQQSLDEATDLLTELQRHVYGDMLAKVRLFIGPKRCGACSEGTPCAVHAEPEGNG